MNKRRAIRVMEEADAKGVEQRYISQSYDSEIEGITVFRAPVAECIKETMMSRAAGQLARQHGYQQSFSDNRSGEARER